MTCSVEEVRAFIADAKKSRESWLTMADRSWSEIKKRQKNNRIWSTIPNAAKRRAKFAVWYSIFKIRQPLLLSRTGIPICKDTTQDGIDNVGATAALLKERLAINLSKSFNFFDVLSTARDDFLATNFGQVRAYYERDEVTEKVKERITPQKVPGTEEVVFLDAAGEVIESDDIAQDDDGFFIETDRLVDVENERVCLEPLLYKDKFVDPDIRRWNRCERVAFALHFSERQFEAVFGRAALTRLKLAADTDESKTKKQSITVYEYWDRYEKEVKWLPEDGEEFVTPVGYYLPEEYEEGEQPNGLYDLESFFPCPDPLISNQSTDEFWPIPEYYQLLEIIEDIHNIFSRMLAVTKAIRARLLFDNSIEGLQAALNEATEGDAFGIDNLAASLVSSGGRLDNVVQYIPVEKMVESLGNLYQAFEQRLNLIYKLTGTSDLLQGLITDGTQRTFGERQMLEKYALNQIAEPQRKMQDFVRDCYELLCEMALKNFKDESLERYIIPRTLPPEHQNNYASALALLKDDRKRFRIELETDSTIALNEQYDKAMRVELVNTLTGALEKTANIAQQSPALLSVELHCLKFLIQGFRQGKMFQQEITQAIDAVIKQAQAASSEEMPPNPDMLKVQLEQQRVQGELKLKEYQILSNERIETARLQLQQSIASIEAQIEQMKAQNDQLNKQASLSLNYEKVRNDIAVAQAELGQKRDELMISVQKLADDRNADAYSTAAQERMALFDQELKRASQQLEEYRTYMDMQERWATESRLQQEADLARALRQMEVLQKQAEVNQQAILAATEAQAMRAPPPPKSKKRISVKRDELGNMSQIDIEGGDGYRVVRDEAGEIVGYEPMGGL